MGTIRAKGMLVSVRKWSVASIITPSTNNTTMQQRHSWREYSSRRASFNNPRSDRPTLHYDVLGLTPKATQGEIKSAYYKLSMTYHPDRNQGSDSAALKFRQLNDAYEILGNLATRKRYDQGLSINAGAGPSTPSSSTAYGDSFEDLLSKERRFQSRSPVRSGRTPIYDYDDWVKNHYGDLFNLKMAANQRIPRHKERARYHESNKKVIRFFALMVMSGFGLIGAVFLIDEYDL